MADTATGEYRYQPDVVLPPGDTLAEVLEESNMTQAELAKRTGLSTKHINQIVNGSAPITPETALLLETRHGSRGASVEQSRGCLSRASVASGRGSALAEDVGWLDELPINELIRRGLIDKGGTPIDRLRSVCRFFGVANRAAWDALWHKPTVYRTSRAFTSDPGAVAAWLRIGEIEAATLDCASFSRTGLTAILGDLRSLTRDPDPHSWSSSLIEKCASVGVAVVLEPEIKGGAG